jgi:osmotically inducible protein OsmC
MPTRSANAEWEGNLEEGSGTIEFGSYEGKYSVPSRFEDGDGTNPEEMIGAAHAGCFSMAFSLVLGEEGYEPETIETDADVTVEQQGEDFVIPKVELTTEAEVPEIDEETFEELAEAAKNACPVSKALAGVEEITLEANLA